MKSQWVVMAAALCLSVPALAQNKTGVAPPAKRAQTNRPAVPMIILPPVSSQNGAISTPRATFAMGQTVPITFTVSNPTKTDAVYNFQTGQKFDVTILDSKGTMVWDWSRGKLFSQDLSRLTIAPHKKMDFDAVWSGRDFAGKLVPPGVYTINARMTSTTGTAITGGFIVNTEPDPNNMGMKTKTPAERGAIRQVDTTPPVTASKRITIVAAAPGSHASGRK